MGIEEKLREIIHHHLSVVLEYNPFERFDGISDKESFLEMIGNDPAFAPFFLDNPKYVTARIGGNLIVSLHRKLGDMYEEIFKTLLADKFQIPEEELSYSLILNIDGKLQKRSTDGMIKYSSLSKKDKFRLRNFISEDSKGMGFEVRSCYQIGDSKRIQADRDMALALKKEGIDPVMLIFCTSSLKSPVKRLAEFWTIFEGENTFGFIRGLTGFDLYSFLHGEHKMIHNLVGQIFGMM